MVHAGRRARYIAQRTSVDDLNTRLENSLGGVQLVKAANTEDYETERLIQRLLDRSTAEHTVFAIARRLSAVKWADTVFVIEDGRIVERGTHEELLNQGGTYATLRSVQAGEIDAVDSSLSIENGD